MFSVLEFPLASEAVTVTALVPAGVPGVLCVLLHAETPETTRRSAIAIQICPYFMDGFFLRRNVIRNASSKPGNIPKAAHGPRPNGETPKLLCCTGVACVVKIVSVTVWLLLQPVSVSVGGLNTQELAAGRPLQAKLMLPVYTLVVIAKENRADCPAATALACCELSALENDGATTVRVAGVEVDTLKNGSPL